MDEDLDRLVARCAAMLTSEKSESVTGGVFLLLEAHTESPGRSARGWDEYFARLAQEIAAYKGGVVLRTLLQQAAKPYETGTVDSVRKMTYGFAICSKALGHLAGTRVVMDFCLRDAKPQGLMTTLFFDTLRVARALRPRDKMRILMVEAGLEGLANFARRSRAIRQLLQKLAAEHHLFAELAHFISKEYLTAMACAEHARNPDVGGRHGLLKIVTAVLRTTPPEEQTDFPCSPRLSAPAFRCTKALLCLVETDATVQKLRACNAMSVLGPHRAIIDDSQPGCKPWAYILGRLQGRPVASEQAPIPMSAEEFTEFWKAGTGDIWTPIVCSWKLCTAGPEPDAGEKFSRCARCQVAHYCSKDHQKLHWPTHKTHCLAEPSKVGCA